MRSVILAITLASLASGIWAQKQSQRTRTILRSLEHQLTCAGPVRPVMTIKALRRWGIISGRSYEVIESKNYFRVRRSIRIFGFVVRDVIGFGNSRMFSPAPGMLPPPLLGVIVRADVPVVKAKLASLATRKLDIDEADGVVWKRPTSEKLTEIVCYNWP
jgi:hypothetical protein